jgi:hypothetical protein
VPRQVTRPFGFIFLGSCPHSRLSNLHYVLIEYHCPQCLYDNGCEEDRISIIQSVSLLAFWYSDLGERTESWHWMGIAISLSQTLGLNRDPDRARYNTRLSDRQRRLWQRIWWSMFRFLSFLMFCFPFLLYIESRNFRSHLPSLTLYYFLQAAFSVIAG